MLQPGQFYLSPNQVYNIINTHLCSNVYTVTVSACDEYTCMHVVNAGLPIPLNLNIAESTVASISLKWDYPPPHSEAIQNFLVNA